MAFRRRVARGFGRRRRKGPETWTTAICFESQDIWQNSPCSDPIATAFSLVTPVMPVDPVDPTEATGLIDIKSRTVLGIKFQVEHFTNPEEWSCGLSCDPSPCDITAQLWIWEAIVLLPMAQGSKTLLSYIPNFASNNQVADMADRVLWKRLTYLPLWGVNVANVPQLVSTTFNNPATAGAQRVKARVRVDDRHGLFYVVNYVHDLVIPAHDPAQCNLKILKNGWFKVFYRTSLGR